MNKINENYTIIMSNFVYRDSENPLCEYFNVNNIIFNFIPDSTEVPLIDQIVYKSNDKKILLIVDLSTLKKLCEQSSIYNDFKYMVNAGRIKLIYFELSDSLVFTHTDLEFEKNQTIKVADLIKDIKFIWFADFVIGDNFFKRFREVELYEMHHPAINFFNCNHFFHLKKEKEKTNTFFSLIRLHGGTGRRHRNILAEKMQNKLYLKNAICKSNFAETKEKKDLLFADIELEYGKIHLSQGTWKDSLPVISLYEKTYFELVTETVGALDGDDSFYITEKTLKPIMMGHPFIVLSTKHFLKNLRGLGFKTFGDFIDESYDECDTVVERVEIISKNLERLNMDASKEFYEGTKEIQKHNQRHLMHLHGRYRFDLWHKFNNFFINLE